MIELCSFNNKISQPHSAAITAKAAEYKKKLAEIFPDEKFIAG